MGVYKVHRPRKSRLEVQKANTAYNTTEQNLKIDVLAYNMQPYVTELWVGKSDILESEAVTYPGSPISIVFYTKDTPVKHAVIAHEISHVIDCLGDEIGDVLKGEPRAYLQGYLYEVCLDALKRLNIKAK